MINSKTALNKMYNKIASPIADTETYAIGYGFYYKDYITWMKSEGFRTDTTKCTAIRWMETWLDIGALIKIHGDRPGDFALWYRDVEKKAKEWVGSSAYSGNLNSVYDSMGTYNPDMRTGGEVSDS